MSPEYHTPEMLADRWGIRRETVYRLLHDKKLKGFKVGKDWRITDAARIEYETCGGVPEQPQRALPRMTKPVLRVT